MSALGNRRGLPAAAYTLLAVTGWLASNALLTMGVLAALFILFANATAEGFFTEAGNLAARFLAADASKRTVFMDGLAMAAASVFLTFCLARSMPMRALARSIYQLCRPNASGKEVM